MKRLSQTFPIRENVHGPTGRASRSLFIAGLSGLLLLLLVDFMTIGRQASWQDEIFFVSTGWSLAQSKAPIMSVMEQYPRTDSPIQFYGPVSFEVDAQLIRVLGLSLVAWRFLCLVGVILTLLLSSSLVKLAGGDRWAQLITALIIGLAQSVNSNLPGRFDAVTTALFLSGLLLLLRGADVGGRALFWGAILGGAFIGVALGSTPRSLTLSLAAAISALLTAVGFRKVRKRFLFGTAAIFVIAVSVQSLLLLPWGMNSLSWYAYVRQATKVDTINATSVVGQGTWDFDLHWHKATFLVLLLLILTGLLGALAQRGRGTNKKKIALKFFLTAFAVVNLSLMMLLLAHPLGQSPYWLPPVVVGVMCWFDLEIFKAKALGPIAAGLVGACMSVLIFQNVQNILSAVLTLEPKEQRRSDPVREAHRGTWVGGVRSSERIFLSRGTCRRQIPISVRASTCRPVLRARRLNGRQARRGNLCSLYIHHVAGDKPLTSLGGRAHAPSPSREIAAEIGGIEPASSLRVEGRIARPSTTHRGEVWFSRRGYLSVEELRPLWKGLKRSGGISADARIECRPRYNRHRGGGELSVPTKSAVARKLSAWRSFVTQSCTVTGLGCTTPMHGNERG